MIINRKYWIVRSAGVEDEEEAKKQPLYYFKVGEHVIEAETGERAVEIARKFTIGEYPAHNYVPKSWRLIGQSHPQQVLLRAQGKGGAVHYETEDGEHKKRTEEEVWEWLEADWDEDEEVK